uniref:MULE transposase domain-containing protein n=1 Tax=Cannabis sativa TaxID=3483 RepID=A0A803Q878_CANSA
MWYKLRMLGLIWLMRLKNEGESEEGSEDDYVEDPEYAQEDNGILIDEQGENHLLRKGRKHVEIDVEDEDMGVSSFQQKVNKDYVLEISRNKAYRARLLATKTIEGSYEEQYAALWDYAEEIKYTNKGSTIEFLTEHAENGVPRFKRMYLCYPGLRDSFNEGSRPVIGLNGCHIKGVHLSQLLTTIGVDGNNQMFPVAFTVVKIENKDLWSWFLNLLRIDLKIENSNHWTFITAEQKRLEQSLKGMWDERVPEAEHRHCARHL